MSADVDKWGAIRCTVCGGSRLRDDDGTIDACSFVGCKAPTADYEREKATRDASKAAGYAEAVADIRQMLALERRRERSAGNWSAVNLLARLGGMLAKGAHVGAAKKGAT